MKSSKYSEHKSTAKPEHNPGRAYHSAKEQRIATSRSETPQGGSAHHTDKCRKSDK
jgi:hypothetical protein